MELKIPDWFHDLVHQLEDDNKIKELYQEALNTDKENQRYKEQYYRNTVNFALGKRAGLEQQKRISPEEYEKQSLGELKKKVQGLVKEQDKGKGFTQDQSVDYTYKPTRADLHREKAATIQKELEAGKARTGGDKELDTAQDKMLAQISHFKEKEAKGLDDYVSANELDKLVKQLEQDIRERGLNKGKEHEKNLEKEL